MEKVQIGDLRGRMVRDTLGGTPTVPLDTSPERMEGGDAPSPLQRCLLACSLAGVENIPPGEGSSNLPLSTNQQ
jgi:hypothetical protein